jgi:hypothetical protein
LTTTDYTIAWVLLILQVAAVEGQSLITHKYAGTLTAHLRQWFAYEVRPGQKPPAWWRARRWAWIAFMGWLLTHVARAWGQ